MDIWSACKDAVIPLPLSGELVRIVECQRQIATIGLVDTLEEQALLEELIEASKPVAIQRSRHLHYLLTTPFRYPPLCYGSRFGARTAPSLFYGALHVDTALAETAYYRFLFWTGMTVAPPAGRLVTQHTAFGANYRTARGLRLQAPPFLPYQAQITNPVSYADSQPLGDALREAGIEAFEYRSARDRNGGINMALFHAAVFTETKPAWQQTWLCETRADRVICTSIGMDTRTHDLDAFLVDDVLPHPCT